eukprot:400114-Rhodomonas_salina.1
MSSPAPPAPPPSVGAERGDGGVCARTEALVMKPSSMQLRAYVQELQPQGRPAPDTPDTPPLLPSSSSLRALTPCTPLSPLIPLRVS